MAIDLISVGSSDNDGTGETLRAGLTKANGMFTELYGATTQTVTLLTADSDAALQAKIDAVPKYIPHGVNIIFRFENGAHTTSASMLFEGFYGGGTVSIQGDITETDATALHTTQEATIVTTGNHGISINRVYCDIEVINLKVTTDDGKRGISIIYTPYAEVRYNYLISVGKTSTGSRSIMLGYVGCANVTYNYVSNSYYGIYISSASTAICATNDDTGTLPNYGLWAVSAGTLGKSGTTPSGSTSNEGSQSGGIIR